MQVIFMPLEERVLFYFEHDIQVAGRPAIASGLAFMGQAHARSLVHTRGYIDLQFALHLPRPASMAIPARRTDDLPASAALPAGAPHREETLLINHLTPSLASGAGGGTASGLRAFACAMFTRLRARHLDVRGQAENRVFEADLQIVANILAALRTGSAPPATPPEQISETEELAENIADIEIVGVESLRRALHSLVPKAIVCRAFLRITQYAVCLRRLFKFLLGRVIPWVSIRMALQSELAIGTLDLLVVGVSGYT